MNQMRCQIVGGALWDSGKYVLDGDLDPSAGSEEHFGCSSWLYPELHAVIYSALFARGSSDIRKMFIISGSQRLEYVHMHTQTHKRNQGLF